MGTPWGSAFDQETVAEQACGPGMHWDGNACVPDTAGLSLGDVDWRGVQQQAALKLLKDPNWAGNAPTANQPVRNTSTGEMISANDALARLNDPGWGGNWTPEELAYFNAAQNAGFFTAPDASAGVAPPAPAPAPVPAAAGGYVQQGIVSPGISDAEQAWLDAAIEQDAFLGDLVQVPVEQTLSMYDPDAVASGVMVDDPRLQMRIDLAEDLLGQGYTVADIEQFLGMDSLLTDEELGTVAGTRVDPDFAGVGTDQWFDHLAAQGIEVDPSGRVTKPWTESPEFLEMYSAPSGDDGAGGNGAGGDGAGGDGAGGDGAGGNGEPPPPDGVPTYVAEQVDRIDIIDNRLKEIGDALTKARDLGLGEIDTIEAELRAAEQSIYDSQYGTIDPITGEMMNPGEMDRLLTTYRDRRTKSKKTRAENRANIVAIMAAEGVDAGLAQTELDMIDALHGDAVDTAYNYIDSLWRIGKMSHDERDSMISNMMGSYRLQLRDQVVEMLMAEEITAADQRFVANQEALSADTIADLFPNMTENQVYGLMGAGLGDLLELPGEQEIGMITEGEWAGYTSGQKANALVNAGWTQNADGTFSPPAADDETIITTTLPNGTPFTGTADEYWAQTGQYPFAPAEEAGRTYKKTLPNGDPFEGTPEEYFQLTGERMFAPDEDPADDLGSFRADVGVLRDMGYGDWLDGQIAAGNLTIEGASAGSVKQGKVFPASDGYVNINWADYPTEFDVPITPKEEAERTYLLPLSRFTSSAAELTAMGASVSGDTVSLSPQLATDLMALGVLKDVEVEEDPYDPFERFNTGIPESFLEGAAPPVGVEIRDGELWMTPDGYSKFVDEMNYEEPEVPTHGVDAGVTLDIALRDMGPPNYYDGMLRPLALEWNEYLKDEKGDDHGYDEFGALANAAIRAFAASYVTEAKIIAHVDNRVVYGREAGARNVSVSSPGHSAGAETPAGNPYFAAVPVANGRIAMIYGSSEQAVKDAVKQAYPDKR
jgi:hypothetical protein